MCSCCKAVCPSGWPAANGSRGKTSPTRLHATSVARRQEGHTRGMLIRVHRDVVGGWSAHARWGHSLRTLSYKHSMRCAVSPAALSQAHAATQMPRLKTRPHPLNRTHTGHTTGRMAQEGAAPRTHTHTTAAHSGPAYFGALRGQGQARSTNSPRAVCEVLQVHRTAATLPPTLTITLCSCSRSRGTHCPHHPLAAALNITPP